MKRIYLDVCCFNRPFDDKTQARVRMESEAVLILLDAVRDGQHEMVSSEVVELEVSRNPDPEVRQKIGDVLRLAAHDVRISEVESERAAELEAAGFGAYDALHVACAESARADVLLSTDDDLVKRASAMKSIGLAVRNPAEWLVEEST